MLHQLNLCHEPFIAITKGNKRIEMRLFDEKKSLIQIGDILEFTDLESKEKVKCRVINVKTYPSFVELYQDNDKVLLGYEKDDIASPDDMLKYYSKERQAKYLAMAIYIEII